VLTRYPEIVLVMTTMTAWRRRGGVAATGAALVVAAVLGPAMTATRLGVGETVGFATVSAADTIRSTRMLADVPAEGVSETDQTV
jgi:hypothetical protein